MTTFSLIPRTLEDIDFQYKQTLSGSQVWVQVMGQAAAYVAAASTYIRRDSLFGDDELTYLNETGYLRVAIRNDINAKIEADYQRCAAFINSSQPPVVQLEVQPGIVGRVTAADFRQCGHMGTVTDADIEVLAITVRQILMKSGIWKEAVEDALLQLRIIDASLPRIGALITAAERINIDGLTIPLGTVGEIVSMDGAGNIEATFEGAADDEVCYELSESQYRLLRCDNNFKVGDVVVFTNNTTLLRDVPKGKTRRAVGRLAVEKGQIGRVKHWRNENAISVQVLGQPPSDWYTVDPLTVCVVSGDVTGFRQWFEDFDTD